MLFLRIGMCAVYIKSVVEPGGKDNSYVRLYNMFFCLFILMSGRRGFVLRGCREIKGIRQNKLTDFLPELLIKSKRLPRMNIIKHEQPGRLTFLFIKIIYQNNLIDAMIPTERRKIMAEKAELKRTLTLWQVVFMGLAWNTPMIYFSVFGVAFEGSSGFLTPAYIFAVVAIIFTGTSYAIMAKKIPISGSAYTFAKKAIHPNAGFLVGWLLLFNYLFAPIIACITFGVFLNAQFPGVPAPVWIIGLIVLLAAIAAMGINSSANLSGLFVIMQIVFIIAFCIILIRGLWTGEGAGGLFSIQPFAGDLTVPIMLAGASVVIFSFLGFDTITTLSEETIDPQKTIPRAIFIMIGIISVLHISSSYLIQLAQPAFSFVNIDSAAMELMALIGGSALNAIFMTVLIAAIFTQGLASITAVSRLLYVMGRDGILPEKYFGYIHPRFKTPVFNIGLASVLSILALFISVDAALRFVNFGALTAFFFVNISVIALAVRQKETTSLYQRIFYIGVPGIGAFIMLWLLFLLDTPTIIGGMIWVGVGLIYMLYLTRTFTKPLPGTVKQTVILK